MRESLRYFRISHPFCALSSRPSSRLWAHQEQPPRKAFRRKASTRPQFPVRFSDCGACSWPATAIRKRRFVLEKAQLDALACDIGEFDFTGALLKLDDIVKEHGLDREEVIG